MQETADGHRYQFGDTGAWRDYPVLHGRVLHLRQKTVVVVGVPKGGTSMVAAVIDALGIPMGPPGDLRQGGAWEDQEFMRLSYPEVLDVIAARNAARPAWGWKNPAGASQLNLLPHLRNPYCVYVSRDPAALARYYGEPGWDPWRRLAGAAEELGRLYRAAEEVGCPGLLVSYERARAVPEGLVRALAGFLGLRPGPDQWVEALARVSRRGGYIQLPETER